MTARVLSCLDSQRQVTLADLGMAVLSVQGRSPTGHVDFLQEGG